MDTGMGYEHNMMWYGDDTDTVVRENLKRRYFSESHYVSLSLKIKCYKSFFFFIPNNFTLLLCNKVQIRVRSSIQKEYDISNLKRLIFILWILLGFVSASIEGVFDADTIPI